MPDGRPRLLGGVLAEAEAEEPAAFVTNGWVVGALQAAWSAITHTPVPSDVPCRHLPDALATAIGIGRDTDTVAAIADALLEARWGVAPCPPSGAGSCTAGRGSGLTDAGRQDG